MVLELSMKSNPYLNIINKNADYVSCPAKENCIGTHSISIKANPYPLLGVFKKAWNSGNRCIFMKQGETRGTFSEIVYIKEVGTHD